jgi:hypothetical protein
VVRLREVRRKEERKDGMVGIPTRTKTALGIPEIADRQALVARAAGVFSEQCLAGGPRECGAPSLCNRQGAYFSGDSGER